MFYIISICSIFCQHLQKSANWIVTKILYIKYILIPQWSHILVSICSIEGGFYFEHFSKNYNIYFCCIHLPRKSLKTFNKIIIMREYIFFVTNLAKNIHKGASPPGIHNKHIFNKNETPPIHHIFLQWSEATSNAATAACALEGFIRVAL